MLDPYIQKYGRRLYGLCLTLCANKFDADDLYQTTWLKAMEHFNQYQENLPFEPWLTRICINTYRSRLRRIARSPIFNAFRSDEEKAHVLECTPTPEPEDYSELHSAIDHLPEKLRLTVVLFYFENMDITTISTVLNIPPGTVKSRLNKARKKLKEELQDETNL